MNASRAQTSHERRTQPARRGRRLRLVAFGGGTGLPVLLAGLRDRRDCAVTAVVTVADDGGSSGRLRRELGVAPPGDLRRCLAALARDRRLAEVFGRRFAGAGELEGHALGNLIITGLAERSGDFTAGVGHAAHLLAVRGAVYPAARSALTLVLHTADGAALIGESSVASRNGSLARVAAVAPGSPAPAGVLRAIARADAVILSAGSLFTSTIAALLGSGTREALAGFAGPVIYVANLWTQPGETEGFSLADHVRAIAGHGGPRVTDVLVPSEPLPEPAAAAVAIDEGALERMGVAVRSAPLLPAAADPAIRHDAGRLAQAVLAVAARDGHVDVAGALAQRPRTLKASVERRLCEPVPATTTSR